MGYGFIDFGGRAYVHTPSIQTIVNELNFDTNVWADGFTFQTLRVEGRGKISYSTESEDVVGADGLYEYYTTADEREIKITARIIGRTNEAYRQGLAKLNAYLFEAKRVKLKFTDDEDCYYNATISSVEDGEEESNKQTLEIVFTCLDVFKYTEEKSYSMNGNGTVRLDTDLSLFPESIVLEFTSTTGANDFTLTNPNQDKRIVVKNNGASSQRVTIGLKDNYIRYGGSDKNRLDVLNVKASNFDTFTVNDGEHLSVSKPVSKITVNYKGVKI